MFVSLVSCNMNSNKTAETNDVAMTAADATYNIVQDESSLMWTGREVSTSSHYGTINFTSGQFEIADGLISQGEFFVDMTSITVQDLTGGSKDRLEGHLRSDDFFSVESFPTAHLYISSSEAIYLAIDVIPEFFPQYLGYPSGLESKGECLNHSVADPADTHLSTKL